MPYRLGDQPAAWNSAGRKAAVPIVTQPRQVKMTASRVTTRARWRPAGAGAATTGRSTGVSRRPLWRSPTAINTPTGSAIDASP